jgi:hypothetical protein
MPIRGEKFDKLNLVKQGGVMLAYSVVAGQLIGRTKEAIHSTKCIRFDYRHPVIINEPVLSYDIPVFLTYIVKLQCFPEVRWNWW